MSSKLATSNEHYFLNGKKAHETFFILHDQSILLRPALVGPCRILSIFIPRRLSGTISGGEKNHYYIIHYFE